MREIIIKILCEICDTDQIEKDPDIEIFREGLLDSFGTVEFLVAIQAQLGIEVAPSEVERDAWATPNKIIAYLEDRGRA